MIQNGLHQGEGAPYTPNTENIFEKCMIKNMDFRGTPTLLDLLCNMRGWE